MLSRFCTIMMIFYHIYSYTTEVDSFTHRSIYLRDAREDINRHIEEYFQYAIKKANKKMTCDPWVFMDALIDRGGGSIFSTFERDLEKDDQIDKKVTNREDSVYQDFTWFESLGIHVTNFAHLMRVDDIYIGTDKFGHFLDMGYAYFKKLYRDNKSLTEVLRFGERSERTYYGLAITGIYSYADLAANLDGVNFWKRVAGLVEGQEPYVKCIDNHWVLNAHFDVMDYVNPAWDEGINCNTYSTAKMQQKVDFRIRELEKDRGERLQCPIAPQYCSQMINHYKEAAESVISPICFSEIG